MKKNVAKLLVVCLLMTMVMALVSCGGSKEESPYVGTWNAVNISYGGVEMAPEDVALEFTLVINEDGTLAATTNGEADGEGKWEATDDGISITDATGSDMSGALNDSGQLVVDFGDDFIVTLEKAE
ncbi:MAG: hypothetical protein K6B12_01045 [Clostridiales bacterium]|nr:hypothetical protein [Clostridiales bacterium]